jgi:hypothetical protein
MIGCDANASVNLVVVGEQQVSAADQRHEHPNVQR